MPLLGHGFLLGPAPAPLTMKEYHNAICPEWISTPAAFVGCAIRMPLRLAPGIADTTELRGIMLCNKLGLVENRRGCPTCEGQVVLRHHKQKGRTNWDYR